MIRDALQVETTEGAALRRELAGPGSRCAAGLVDLAVLGGSWLAVCLLLVLFTAGDPTGLGGVLLAVLLGGTLLVLIGYQVVFALLMDGQTPGKRLLGIQVTDVDGFPASPLQHLQRSLFWPLEALVTLPLPLGLIPMTLTERNQRLGDLVAGTTVLRVGLQRAPREPFARDRWSELQRRTLPLVPALAGRLGREAARFLRGLLAREGLDDATRQELYRRAAEHYYRRLGLPAARDPKVALKEIYLFLRETRQGSVEGVAR